MKLDRRLVAAVGLIGLATVVWLLLTLGLVAATLEPAQRAMVAEQLGPRLLFIVLTWLAGLVVISATLRWLFRRYASAPARLLEQTRILLAAPKAAPLNHEGTQETRALAEAIYALASQRDALREDVATQIEQASLSVQQEKNRLAALMAELTQSVVVCNLDGRILLYNSRARLQFKTLSQAPTLAGGAELVGIGRSIYAVFDRRLVAHALESIQQRLQRGAGSPSAQFVTTTQAGQLLRVQMAPVRTVDAGDSAHISGFVLMLDNVTRAFEEEHLRDQLLHSLTEGSRSSLANIQAATDMLAYPDLDADMRERFLGVVRDEVGSMGTRLNDMSRQAAQGLKARWPLEEMLGSDVLLAVQRRIEARNQRGVTLENLDASVWLRVDSYSLAQALDYLAARLVDEFDVKFFRLRLQVHGARAQLDLIWTGQVMSTETVMSWEMDAMRFGQESTPLTVRDVVERHGGEMWFERERVRHEAFFRFLLPLATVQEQVEATQILQNDSRPEYYDFDLFQTSEHSSALDDRLLSELSYTVFDTETTGLNPSEGDQIIQIGATRCVNSKLLKQESFEQLVNPGRLIPAAGIPIHGITQDMVQGQPDITAVLPIAARFDISVLGRHTALGDALVTAEVFLRLIPLLQAMGIHTLRQAREAAQATYYARLRY